MASMTEVIASANCASAGVNARLPSNLQLLREEPNMRIFLTGASGYIGTAVAERLRAAGHQVSGLARSDASAAKLSAAGIQPVPGDFSDPTSVASGARSADAVISLATTYDSAVDGPAVDAI